MESGFNNNLLEKIESCLEMKKDIAKKNFVANISCKQSICGVTKRRELRKKREDCSKKMIAFLASKH